MRLIEGCLCVVLEQEVGYFYISIDKRYVVSFKNIVPNLMVSNSEKTLYITERKRTTIRQSFSSFPFSPKEIFEAQPSKASCSSGKTVYTYNKFNIRKNGISPDHKYTFKGPI